MNQSEFPFHESAEDATNMAIIRSGRHFKEIAHALWPEHKPDSAYARLKNSLRPDAREKLTADQHVLIANLCGEYDFLYYVAQGCHHSRPDPVKPEDEQATLQKQFIASVVELRQLANRINAKAGDA